MTSRLIFLNSELVRIKALIALEKDPAILEQLRAELEWIKNRIKEIGDKKCELIN